MNIEVSSRFERRYRKLSKELKKITKEKEFLFRENVYHPSLHTHPLHGKDAGAWAFSINQKHRIKFIFLSNDSVLFLDIGTHDIYR